MIRADSQIHDSSIFRGDNLAVVRGGRAVFSGLSFVVSPGRALRLAGPNGSGKSSLIRLMAGLLRPALGAMHWGETPVSDDPDTHASRLVFLGHADGLKPSLTAWENADFQLRLRGAGKRRRSEALAQAFEHLDISPLRDLPAGWLSSGQRRRTALAAVLASKAPLWLLDEPTVGLDRASVAALERAVEGHLGRGGAVVAATHTAFDLGEAVTDLDPAAYAPNTASLSEFGEGWGIS